jgi:hypothetical protein
LGGVDGIAEEMNNDLNIIVSVVLPKIVTPKMLLGAFLAMIYRNTRYLLKYGWEIKIDREVPNCIGND